MRVFSDLIHIEVEIRQYVNLIHYQNIADGDAEAAIAIYKREAEIFIKSL